LGEAHAFAREELGLARGHYRIINTPGTIKSIRNVDVHLVPGWQNRYDRFAMRGALRWSRVNIIDHTEQAKVPAGEPDNLEPPGVQPPLNADEAHDFFAEVTNGDSMIAEGGPVDPDPVKRRRRRCNDCGTLHFKEDACVATEPLEGV
jgi:hypothetical protein